MCSDSPAPRLYLWRCPQVADSASASVSAHAIMSPGGKSRREWFTLLVNLCSKGFSCITYSSEGLCHVYFSQVRQSQKRSFLWKSYIQRSSCQRVSSTRNTDLIHLKSFSLWLTWNWHLTKQKPRGLKFLHSSFSVLRPWFIKFYNSCVSFLDVAFGSWG